MKLTGRTYTPALAQSNNPETWVFFAESVYTPVTVGKNSTGHAHCTTLTSTYASTQIANKGCQAIASRVGHLRSTLSVSSWSAKPEVGTIFWEMARPLVAMR